TMVIQSHEFSRTSQEQFRPHAEERRKSAVADLCCVSKHGGTYGVDKGVWKERALGHASRRVISRQAPTDNAPQHEVEVCSLTLTPGRRRTRGPNVRAA